MHVLKLVFLAVALSSAPSAVAHENKQQASTYAK